MLRPSPSTLRRFAAAALLGAVTAAGAVPATAGAAPAKKTLKKSIWGPVRVAGKPQFPIYRDLGVGIFQHGLVWQDAAPTRPADPKNPADPAYVWPAALDDAVAQGKKYGIRVAIEVLRTPGWANGGQDGNVPPSDAQDYANFLAAAAKRYPNVHLWMVWGEPIRYVNFAFPLTPAGRSTAAPLLPAQKDAVQRYATLLDRGYVSLKRASRKNLVIGGNTTTTGDILPLNWIKNLRLADGKPPRMDMFGHNPFGTRGPDLAKKPLQPGTADFSDLDTLTRWVDRYVGRGGRNRKLPIFISEYTAPTNQASFEFNYHVTRAVQANWLTSALKIARGWSRIYTLGWIGLRDIPPRPQDGKASNVGLIDAHGVRKPSYYAFKRG